MPEHIASEEAYLALAEVARARAQVAAEIGLPRAYWWGMAAGWVALGVIGDVAPAWVVTVATVAFGVGHSTIASRLLDGRRRTRQVRVRADVASRRLPVVVVGMLVALVAVTVGISLLLDGDGAVHAQIWAAGMIALTIGFGGPEILAFLRRVFRA